MDVSDDVGYGLLIPNRWQRTAWMIAYVLGAVALVDAWNLTQFPITASVAATTLGAKWSLLRRPDPPPASSNWRETP